MNVVEWMHPRAESRGPTLERPAVAAPSPIRSATQATALWYLVLVGALLIQGLVLHTTAAEDVAAYYPRYYDQAVFLGDAYAAYERSRTVGIGRALAEALAWPREQAAAQGWLLPVEAAGLFTLVGPGRLGAIDLNILYLLAYSGITAEIVRRRLGTAAGLVVLGLIASLGTTTYFAGGVFDFRLDFAGVCLWGAFLALLGFSYPDARRAGFWSVVVAGLLLMLTRLITTFYVLPLMAALWLMAVTARLRLSPAAAWRRLPWQIGITMAIWLSVLAVAVALNWAHINAYYVQGHVTGDEKSVRQQEFGVTNLTQAALFYPVSAARDHAGRTSWVLSGLALVGGAIVRLRSRSPNPTTTHDVAWAWTVLAGGLVIPLVVLTLNESKSPVVGAALVPPLVLMVALAYGQLTRQRTAGGALARAPLLLGGVVLVLGLVASVDRASRAPFAPLPRSELAEATQFLDEIGGYLTRSDRPSVVWSTDQHADYLTTSAVNVVNYERRRKLLPLLRGLGQGSVSEVLAPAEIVRRASDSDVLVLTTDSPSAAPPLYPADRALAEARPLLADVAAREMILLRQAPLFGRTVSAYLKPTVSMAGASGEWITSAGLRLTLEPEVALHATGIVLTGRSEVGWLPALPEVSATLEDEPGQRLAAPSRLDVAGDTYTITIELPPGDARAPATRTIDLQFSTYFVPADLGIAPDARKLVLRVPETRKVLLANTASATR